ncbi:MAG: CHAT domain-containing protein [Planctomycetota bacterium]
MGRRTNAVLLCAAALAAGSYSVVTWRSVGLPSSGQPDGSAAAQIGQDPERAVWDALKAHQGDPAALRAQRRQLGPRIGKGSYWVDATHAAAGCFLFLAGETESDAASKALLRDGLDDLLAWREDAAHGRRARRVAHWVGLALAAVVRDHDPEAALNVLRQLCDDCAPVGDPHAENLLKQAKCLRLLGRWDEAQPLLARCEELEPVAPLVVELLSERAQMLLHVGNYDEAARQIARADALAEHLELHQSLPLVRTKCDYLLCTQGWDRLQPLVAGVLAAPGVSGHNARVLRFYGAVGAVRGSEPEAAEDAVVELESLLSALTPRNRLFAQGLLAEQALDTGDLARAEQWLRRARATKDERGPLQPGALAPGLMVTSLETRLLLQRGARRSALEEQLPKQLGALAELLSRWRRAPRRASGVGFLRYEFRREVLAQLVALRTQLQDGVTGVETALEDVMRAQQRVVEAEGGMRMTLSSARRHLLQGDAHGVLVVLPARASTQVLGFDRREAWHVALPEGIGDLRQRTSGFHQRIVQAASIATAAARRQGGAAILAKIRAAGRAVADPLREALASRLARWRSVTVVGAEMLGEMPFECLPWGDTTLGGALAIDHAPSLPWAVDRAREHQPAADPLRAAFMATVATKGPDLRAEDLTALWGDGPKPQLWLGRACSLQRFEALGPNDVLLLLAHGGRDPGLVRDAILKLHDAPLSSRIVEQRENRGQRLVVLASCEAAVGPERFGEDRPAHLGGAFLRAGSTAVVVTRYEIPLAETVRFLGDALPAILNEGLSPAEALRRARAAVPADSLDGFLASTLQVVGFGQARW